MPVAPSICKEILKALDDHILPALQSRPVPQLLAEPPFDFGEVEHWVLQKKLLPDKTPAPLQMVQQWEKEGVMAVMAPTIMFAYDGVCYERIGITRTIARRMKVEGQPAPGGVLVLRLPSPAVLSHPPQMLRSSGTPRPESQAENGRALIYKLMPDGIRVSLNARGPEKEYATHNLEINDAGLAQLGHLYLEEVRQSSAHESAQALQLALVSRLKRNLLQKRYVVSDSSWVAPKAHPVLAAQSLSPKNQKIYHELLEYVLAHLHLPLTLNDLAVHTGVSSVHLNTIIRQTQGTTVMRYLTQLRIEAAKRILLEKTERMNDVARLVGFSSPASFSIVFRKHTGLSPQEFCNKHRTK